MTLLQLVSNITGEPIGLYTYTPDPLSSKKELTEEEFEAIMVKFHDLNDNEQYEEADELIQANGIERSFIDQEVNVD
jgi:hypothetical protein